jgi:midasin (ATPase involved in ribosome maturation)
MLRTCVFLQKANQNELDFNNEWVSDCCLMPNEQFFSYIFERTSYIQWDDNDVYFVLDQHVLLEIYSATSLKQQSAGRHVAPLGHIILNPSQPVFALFP